MKQKRYLLDESELPKQWYNIQADMPNKPLPPIHPATKQPLGVDDLAHIFPRECCVQELDQLRPSTVLLCQGRGYRQCHHRDWRRAVGSRPCLCRCCIRTRGSCLSGEDLHAAETLPLEHHAHLRSSRYRFAVDVNTCR